MHTVIDCNNVKHLVEVNSTKIFLWTKFGPKWVEIRLKTRCFGHSLKFGSLFFLDMACSDSLHYCLTCSRGTVHKKNFWDPNLGQRGQNWARNYVFCYFFKFDSLVFLQIGYIDSFQLCITSTRGKTYEKKLERVKIMPKISFFAISFPGF